MRLFLGIAIPEEIAGELLRLVERLAPVARDLRWSAPATWHITLQFLGRTEEAQYACVTERLRGVQAAPVPVAMDGTGFFDRAGVFFAGVVVTAELLALQQRITAETQHCGFLPEGRAYAPHITLARSRGRSGAGPLAPLKTAMRGRAKAVFGGFTANEFLLYESLPLPEGSRYEIRERFALTGDG
ncbi:RNA 2',3'-cyclic phosphodiesterase [Paracidobacterium acidisoli]|uniref:RNA 2',3'-cyclic phosphodiesterase n=1 Tax=Paracidobacterium acidisoli TaxID=2303751 RepID=A0A372IMF6_9BACT|nr:RNA 2',3'-cyclic phosphodiesterase [Paracidobacterium acidisoli]MBT9331786.1 RNA 2',3'-cyclic phosphodiesterase [Paracidobacterium acidisoli]